MQEAHQSSRTINRTLLAVSLVAFLVRVTYILLNQRPLASDELEYQAVAANLATRFTYAIDSSPTAFRPVGYPALAALVYSLTGVKPLVLKIVQALCDSVVVLVLPRIFEEPNNRLKVLAAWAWAIFPPAILYTNLVMSESLYTALLVVSCLLFVRHSHRSSHQFLLGIGLGVLTLMRPDTLPFFLFLSLADYRVDRSWRQAAITTAAFAIVVAPWVLRNTIVMGEPTLSTYGGVNLLIGNNPNANGSYTARFPRQALDTTRGEIVTDKQALKLAASFIAEHPGQFVVNGIKKYAQFFSSESYLLVAQFSTESLDSPVALAKRYAAISPVAFVIVNGAYAYVLIAGWFGFLSCRKDRLWYFVATLLSTSLVVHLIVFGGNRFHFPLMPFFVFYSIRYFVLPHDRFSMLAWWQKIAVGLGTLSFLCIWGTEVVILMRQ